MSDDRIAVMADIHGEHRLLASALQRCESLAVRRIVLLGDLFDRLDQVEKCVQQLTDWNVSGVLGNHEREALEFATAHSRTRHEHDDDLVSKFGDRLVIGEAVFVHDAMDWRQDVTSNQRAEVGRIVFAGHTHYRHARDDHGPIDLSLGRIALRADRRYLINPGAVIEGQFAVWNRIDESILFERL